LLFAVFNHGIIFLGRRGRVECSRIGGGSLQKGRDQANFCMKTAMKCDKTYLLGFALKKGVKWQLGAVDEALTDANGLTTNMGTVL
jgi:hypothetical protein